MFQSLNVAMLQTDSDYEYCTWTSPSQEICEFEWKRAVGNITMQECSFSDKVEEHQR